MALQTKNPEKNFWLWGTWGKRVVKAPFLTQKVHGRIRDVIIGHTFIIALNEDGFPYSWGEDKSGCLGLGTENTNVTDPRMIQFPSGFDGKIVDVQYGRHHVLALSNKGKVYSWGENTSGQLGLNDVQTRFEPTFVEELRPYTVIQIMAVDNMSYALTNHGFVYAWGENKDGCLALEHDNPRVMKPEPMMRTKETAVKRLAIKECGGSGASRGKTVIAFVELAEPLKAEEHIGGFKASLGSLPAAEDEGGGGGGGGGEGEGQLAIMENDGQREKDIFEGVDLMRRVMDNTQDWWSHILNVRHGSPYTDNPEHYDDLTDRPAAGDNCTVLQLDTFVNIDILERASYELETLITSASAQMREIRGKKGTKNVKFMLSLFMDDCKLRKEKIRRTVSARQLMDHKKSMKQIPTVYATDLNSQAEIQRITQANSQLTRTLQKVRKMQTYDVFTRALQDSLIECMECKLQVHETQIECLKLRAGQPADAVAPALRTIKERWGALKHFSIYNLFQECVLKGQNVSFGSDDEMLAYLVQRSDDKIDQIIQIGRDKLISEDQLVPSICYDLLMENAELRKMCNAYQLKVLLMRQGKERAGGAVLAIT
eukprot:TRINITY_DN81283_c0_g1_i1.p1 TRINITY_DN81283_c0_g1~~TRINITY_DN81283_c0_g1_i1.p1  ORF type:complete len:598 (-),score=145.48 TRINITY_DN81283_c0_g1_i1:66-1859(-)